MYPVASIAVVNADVRTMNSDAPQAEAILVKNGVVAALGTTGSIGELAAEAGIGVVDAQGRTVLPGFIDAHTHMELACYSLENWPQAHTPPHRSLEEVADVIREFLQTHTGTSFLLVRSSFGMHAKVREGRLFSREELDAITTDRPLGVAAGLHVISLNTPAMKALGVFDLADSQERVIHRNERGEPSGVVTEVLELFPEFDREELATSIRKHLPSLATKYGVTTIGSIAWNSYDHEVFDSLISDGLPIRLKSYPHVPRVATVEAAIEARIDSQMPVESSGIGGLKIFVDGQHGDGIDAVFDDLKWTQADLDAFVRRASDVGTQVIMHAVSTTAIRMALEAIERSNPGEKNPLRHRIEHGADYIEPVDIERAAALGVLLLTTPQFILSAEGESSGPGAPLKSILNSGIRLFGGTDTTGTVPEGAAPLYNIACAMNREGAAADEALEFDEAVRLFTSHAAYAMFEEDTRGELSVGKLGDMVILDRPVDELIEPQEYFELEIETTIFAGSVVYSAGDQVDVA